ncbi:MAG: DMT family transporter [Gemmobacter sp.]|uniref:DMT family transporter n=1 Tax=Gemmobacter sp. TaxID=1898957 RepID=UPI00391CF1C2
MLRQSPNATGALLALAAFFVFSSHDALIKVLAATYSPVQIVFCIALFGFPLILAMVATDRAAGTLLPRNPAWVWVRGLTVAGSSVCGFYAFSVLPMAQVYAILFGTPLMITLLSVPVLGEKVGWRRGLAVVVGMCGVLVVLRPGSAELSLGHLAALASAAMGAMTSVITRRIGQQERAAVLLLYAMAGNFVLMGAMMPWVYLPMPGPDLAVMIAIAAMAFAAMQLVILAYRRAEAVVVAPMQYSQIVWAVVFGTLFFQEQPDAMTLLGAAIVIASGVYIVWREARRKVEGAGVDAGARL